MNYPQAVNAGIANYARFSGRASRSAYWWWVVFTINVVVVALIFDNMLGWAFVDAATGQSSGIGPITFVLSLAILLPSFAVAVRRLHDTDRSGWWLLAGAIPIVGGLVLLWFYINQGTQGANRFGEEQT